MKFIIFLYIALAVIAALFIYNLLYNLYHTRPFFIILQIFILGTVLNIVILLYNMFEFGEHKLKQGPRGPKGESGLVGYRGEVDNCPAYVQPLVLVLVKKK